MRTREEVCSGRGEEGSAPVLPRRAAISGRDGEMDLQPVVRLKDLVLSRASGGGRWEVEGGGGDVRRPLARVRSGKAVMVARG